MRIVWLWLRANRWPTLLGLCVVVAVLNGFAGGDDIPVPSMVGFRRLSVPLGQLLPLLLACAAAVNLRSRTTLLDNTPRSPIALRLATLVPVYAVIVPAGLTFARWPEAVRNTLGLTGLALATAAFAGAARSWTVPMGYVMACLLFGATANTVAGSGPHAASWAFPLASATDVRSLIVAAELSLVGSVAFLLRGTT